MLAQSLKLDCSLVNVLTKNPSGCCSLATRAAVSTSTSKPSCDAVERMGSGVRSGPAVSRSSGREFIDGRKGLTNRLPQMLFVRAALRLCQMPDFCDQSVDQRGNALIM